MENQKSVSRRRFLRNATGVAGGLAISSLGVRRATAQSNRAIKIGHQCDLTGALASSGYWRKKVTDAVAKWLNASGGIAGRPVEVITIDTESKVDVGVLRMRQLIQEQKVDFVIGSEHGGIGIASNPIAQELKTLYLSLCRTDAVNGKAANPYSFHLQVNTSLTAQAAGGWMVGQTGKSWSILYADYVWGHAHRDAWTRSVKAAGGSVLQAVSMPVNTIDPLPYISKLDRSIDAIFVALLAPDLPRAIPALNQMGFATKQRVTADAIFSVFDVLGLGAQANGIWGMDSLPWELKDKDTPHMRLMRSAVGIDEHGREIGSGNFCAMGDIWPAWENIGFLKRNIEAVGWKTRNDTSALIKYAEANPNYPESDLFPQGPLFIRPEDHQAFCDYLTLRIENGKIRVKHRLPKEAGIYPATVNIASR